VARRLARMGMAPYVRNGSREAPRAVGYADHVKLPVRGIEERLGKDQVALRTNSIATVLAAVRQGWGAGDLPCFVGDEAPDLERQHLVARSGGDQPPFVQQQDLVGESRGEVQIVQHADDDEILLLRQRLQLAHELQLVTDVEEGERLVEEQVAAAPGQPDLRQ